MEAVNLRKSVVQQFWQSRHPRAAKILSWMESVEDWGVDDHEAVAQALTRLAERLPNASQKVLSEQTDRLLDIMAYMSAPRALRLLEWLDQRFAQGALSVALVERATARADDARAQVLIDRLQALRSLDLLSQVFSPARIQTVTELLRDDPSLDDA